MKLSKKLFALLLAVVMTMAMSVTAFAASITVKDPVENEKYTVYKIFDVTVNDTETSHSYYVDVNDSTMLNVLQNTIGLKLTRSSDGTRYYVNTVSIPGEGEDEDTTLFVKTDESNMTAAQLAAELKKVENSLGNPAAGPSSITTEGQTLLFDGLSNGYYFVTTTTGSLCILNTTTDTQDIYEKNQAPEVSKDEKTETGNGTAQIGDTVDFTIKITARVGAEEYVLHDIMSDGLSLNANTIKVEYQNETGGMEELAEGNYQLETTDTTCEDDNCAFEITFTKAYLDSLTKDTTIIVTYSATVNENAVVGEDPETNQAILNYGSTSKVETEQGKTETYIYDFEIEKIDKEHNYLPDAEFKLYTSETGGEAIKFVVEDDGIYRVATDAEIAADTDNTKTTDIIAAGEDGKVTVSGLAGKSYWLEETKAPDGYNKLDKRVEVKFVTTGAEGEELTLADSDLEDKPIVNEAGSLLPTTGGTGTTIIYIVGAILVIGAGVLLVTRRRMKAE